MAFLASGRLKYNFARQQQFAQDQSADALAKGEKELAERNTQPQTRVESNEKWALAEREDELASAARLRAAGFAGELKAAADRAAADATARLEGAAPCGRRTAPPPVGGRKERAGREDRFARTYRGRSGRAACPVGPAGRKGLCAGPGNRRAAIEGSASKATRAFQQLLADQGRRAVRPNDDDLRRGISHSPTGRCPQPAITRSEHEETEKTEDWLASVASVSFC